MCLDGGFTCPNRDGHLGRGGCAYCSPVGSWRTGGGNMPEGRPDAPPSLEQQARREIERVSRRYGARRYIAYFQAYSGTYAEPRTLRRLYDRALGVSPDVVALAVGTRPDCVDSEKLDLLASYRERGYLVWVEYGLQSACDRTLERIGRGHDSRCFAEAARLTAERGIGVFAHVIAGLPGEGTREFRHTADFLATLPVQGVKLHNLNILRGTRMARWYREGRVRPLAMDRYADMVVDFLERTNPRVVVARLVADAPKDLLLAPPWSVRKQEVTGCILRRFRERETEQGRLWSENGGQSGCREEAV